ncbi:MAG: hypothetical protein IPH66_06160 [Crocinitomicaceae bacterium]|nr:hypothetical protein [Crocinitomicaceae bacterium]
MHQLEEKVEKKVVDFARRYYSFNYDILFYDVTTLYFETFKEDELRMNGFSKDNKSQQPQILIALMVSKEGFPVSYEVFSGNTLKVTQSSRLLMILLKEMVYKTSPL